MRFQQPSPEVLTSWSPVPDLTTGSEHWWLMMQENWRWPAVRSWDESSYEVLFLWRDPQGTAEHSTTVQVLVQITSVTDSHSLQPDQMQRAPETDVWFWRCVFPRNWRGSYQFIPLTAAQIPQWTTEMDIEYQQRRWWQNLLQAAIADPLNVRPSYVGHGQRRVSYLAMPDAPAEPAWLDWELGRNRGASQSWRWQSALLGNSRRIWLFECGAPPSVCDNRPLVLLLDGEFWAKTMPIFSALMWATGHHQLPPAVYVCIDSIDVAHRRVELPCHELFWQAIMQELLPEIHSRVSCSDRASHTVIAGQSYGGLAAMYAAFRWPGYFGHVLSQSGSFWWAEGALLYQVNDPCWGRAPGMTSSFIRNLATELRHSRLPVRNVPQTTAVHEAAGWKSHIYLEVGDREGAMVSLTQSLSTLLAAQPDCDVQYREYGGGHDRICWRSGLLQGLEWILSSISHARMEKK